VVKRGAHTQVIRPKAGAQGKIVGNPEEKAEAEEKVKSGAICNSKRGKGKK